MIKNGVSHFCLFILFHLFIVSPVYSQKTIIIDQPMSPPEWAILQHEILDRNLEFMELVTDKYIDSLSGHLMCIERWGGSDGPDDAMENFYNWPLAYALGGDIKTLELFEFIWEGHLDQYTNSEIRDPRGSTAYYREFISAYDWEHTGEGIAPFLLLPLADPENPKTVERILRFANFYTGRDTSTHNYDPEHKIIRSVFTGSRKPWLSTTPEQIALNNNSWRSRGSRGVMGDVPLNLISTSLAVNAYMISEDVHYRDWVLEYTNAWLDRTTENDGIIPSNIGLNGIVGEHWEGKWYGGIMGWDWNFGGFRILGRGMRIGFGNAFFLGQDDLFLEALRTQGDILFENNGSSGTYLNNFGDPFWYDPLGAPINELTSWYDRDRSGDTWYEERPSSHLGNHFMDLYTWTWFEEDLNRIYQTSWNDSRFWLLYLQGENPYYPISALQGDLQHLDALTRTVNSDQSLPSQRRSDHGTWPVATNALVNLALGGLQPTKSGGLLYCQLRYFDPVNQHPGFPADVGALIHTIDSEKVIVTLVNTHETESRSIIVQAGAYGEHQIIEYRTSRSGCAVNYNYMTVHLAPQSGDDITLYLERNVNQPTLLFPWNQTGTSVTKLKTQKNKQHLFKIYPNPFNTSTRICISLSQMEKISLKLFNCQGREIHRILNKVKLAAGDHHIQFNGANLASGIYLICIETGDFTRSQKLILIK